jgi:hypothetical protein
MMEAICTSETSVYYSETTQKAVIFEYEVDYVLTMSRSLVEVYRGFTGASVIRALSLIDRMMEMHL